MLDLRYNGGGYLNAAIDVSSKFIPTGPIVTREVARRHRHRVRRREHRDLAAPARRAGQRVHRSASEITAGAIEDSGVGTLVGTKTFGKGVVQTIFPLRDGSAVKITTARYFTPNGHDINTVGIQPQIKSEIPKGTKIRPGDLTQDPQLVAALNFVTGRIAQNPRRPTTSR